MSRNNCTPFLGRFVACVAMVCGISLAASAQESASVFSFLNLPTSAHAVALGGQGASVISDDASLVMYNPALMMSVEKRAVNLNFLTYMQGTKVGSANYVQPAGELGTWGVTAQFLGYGSMLETDVEGHVLGEMSPMDLLVGGGYCRVLGEHWAAGATGKLIYSHYGSYSSVALAIDAGVNYYNEEQAMSLSLTGRNIGTQLKAFGDNRERLPVNVELAFSKGLVGTPLTFHVTLSNLNNWKTKDFSPLGEDVSFGKMLVNHFIIGVDVRPAKMLRISAGYNFRRAYEMKVGESAHGAGLSLGAGLNIKKFALGISWAKYHLSTSSLAFSAQYGF